MRIENWRISIPCILALSAGCEMGQAWSHDAAAVNGTLHWGGVTPTYGTCGNAADGPAAVAVIVPHERNLSSAEPIVYPELFAFGQEPYFLGSPYGFYTTFGGDDTGGGSVIKHAYASARASCAVTYDDGGKDEIRSVMPWAKAAVTVAPDEPAPTAPVSPGVFASINVGMTRSAVLDKLGKPPGSITIPDDDGFVEIWIYQLTDGSTAKLRMEKGVVTSRGPKTAEHER
jgi:hypothetical protein